MLEYIELLMVMLAVASPVFVVTYFVLHFRHKTKTEVLRAQVHAEQADGALKNVEQELALLKDRLKVLEAIVTDSSYDTIKALNNLEAS